MYYLPIDIFVWWLFEREINSACAGFFELKMYVYVLNLYLKNNVVNNSNEYLKFLERGGGEKLVNYSTRCAQTHLDLDLQ